MKFSQLVALFCAMIHLSQPDPSPSQPAPVAPNDTPRTSAAEADSAGGEQMLREVHTVRQEEGPGRRRWFESSDLQLVVWYDGQSRLHGFQLLFWIAAGEHALTWRNGAGFAHYRVDAGDDSPTKNLTPVLQADGRVPWSQVKRLFQQRSNLLDGELRETVLARLQAQA